MFQLLPPRLDCSALRGQGKGGEELGKRRGGRDEEGGGVGEPRLPRAPQCGDFYCGAPALSTHAGEGGPRAPSPTQGGAEAPRRLAVPCVTRAPRVSLAATHRPQALRPNTAEGYPGVPTRRPRPAPTPRKPDAARGRPTVAGTLHHPAYRQSQCRPCP